MGYHIARSRNGAVQGLKSDAPLHSIRLDPYSVDAIGTAVLHLHFSDGTADWVHVRDALAMGILEADAATGLPRVKDGRLSGAWDRLDPDQEGVVMVTADGNALLELGGRHASTRTPDQFIKDFGIKFDGRSAAPYGPRNSWTAPKRVRLSASKMRQYFARAFDELTRQQTAA